MHWLWRETNSRLDRYSASVREGRELDAAAAFCRYLTFSGICALLEENAAPEPLTVDGALIRWKANDLEKEVCNQWRLGKVPETRETQLEVIHHKLDLIAGQLAKIPVGHSMSDTLTFPVLEGGEKS